MIRRTHSGQKMYHLGPAKRDASTLEGLPVEQVHSVLEADFILCTGLIEVTGQAHSAMLKGAALRGIPMICANPDRVVHVRDELQLCAGVVADVYLSFGGIVTWAGKPNALAFQSALEALTLPLSEKAIFMIGDSLQTDIAGAANVGYKAILIAGGIHREDILPCLDQGNPSYLQLAAILQRESQTIPVMESIMPSLKF
jgi:HAD superfamily hydrolase (TIGR01459 family)